MVCEKKTGTPNSILDHLGASECALSSPKIERTPEGMPNIEKYRKEAETRITKWIGSL